ncbi:Gfo/Idh/MocA family oxidoreductase [Acuticoccus sp. MNP-M23]|uniref:Gfo/Idh/MocA family protein n=1 Tax=Acuticoccus sp. MNP-M23 TaxID=3072793 RepID=UPI00281581E6|nr:Gfo/Idh/MocA family oxidoreductase [Acuticoccus sp. MNP-M23]WMS44942.1 Gfo/Idh/MocA family oxidoreductase [Acuticoccus sp. MNP-M23]
MKTIRYGLAGTGMMGHEHIRNIALLDDAVVSAVFDPDDTMREAALSMVPDAKAHPTFAALAADPDIDCLLVASPNYLHLEQLEVALEHRCLPVLVEKPLFTRPADAERVARLAARSPAIWVAMEYRYMPPIAAFIQNAHLATGGVQMLTIREHRYPFLPKVNDWNRFNRYTGGTLVEKCCHFFDLMRLIVGDDPVRVMASAGQAVNHRDERYAGKAPDIWDHGYVIVDFAGGTRAMLELCMFADGSRFQEEISAVGADGKIEVHVPGPTRFWPEHLGAPPVAEVIVSPREPKGPREVLVPVDQTLLEAGDHNGATFYQHRRFADAVRTGSRPEVTLRDGAMAVAIGLAAQHSAENGEAVPLDPNAFRPKMSAS